MMSYAKIINILVSKILTVLRVGLLTQLRHKALDLCLLGPYISYRVYSHRYQEHYEKLLGNKTCYVRIT